ncbi:MAG: hypothetical protein J3R72DRAFT_428372 [Linnemannia gamsii]|nr:MAG: hypothetical protein J3R72DRAFT_428372 [Linnemannia gamsii]
MIEDDSIVLSEQHLLETTVRADAIKALAREEIETEATSSSFPFSVLAHTIKGDLLDPSTRLQAPPLSLCVCPGEHTITISPRTALSFHEGRHQSISEYDVLKVAASSATSYPLQASTGKPLFKDSRNVVGPLFSPPISSSSSSSVGPSVTTLSSPVSFNAPGSAAAASAPRGPPLTKYRELKRHPKHAPRDSRVHLTEEIQKACFKTACEERILIEVGKVVDRAWQKRKREETLDDVFTPEKKAATLDSLSNKGALPA